MPDRNHAADLDPRPASDALARRLRDRRREVGLTLKQVADAAGLSVGFISQIERGIATPSLSSLASVAHALGRDVGAFLQQPGGEAAHTSRTGRTAFSVGGNAVTYERVSASFPGNILRSVIIHTPPGHRHEAVMHEGEELFFMLEGSITLELDGEETVLVAGDSIHFASQRRHASWNHTDAPATILHVCTMDVFGDDAGPQVAPGVSSIARQGSRPTVSGILDEAAPGAEGPAPGTPCQSRERAGPENPIPPETETCTT